NGGGKAEITAVGFEAKCKIRVNRIESFVLERVSLELGHQANAAAFLVLVNHDPAPLVGDGPHGELQLIFAITSQRPQYLAGEALGMNAHERSACCDITEEHHQCGLNFFRAVYNLALKAQELKLAPFGWE